jgi:hypothetical protein
VFAAGAALAVPILKAFGDQETASSNVFQAWPRRVLIALAVALILRAGFLAVDHGHFARARPGTPASAHPATGTSGGPRPPGSSIARLGVDISELEDLHAALTSLIAAARRAGVKPLPAPANDSV